MRWFSLQALLAAALLSAVVALPFLPAAKMRPDLYQLELRVTSPVVAQFQIFYDDGGGIREQLSGRAALQPSAGPVTVRVPIAPGTYRKLRLDPLDRPGNVVLEDLRLISQHGGTLARIPLRDFKPVHQVASVRPRGDGIEITVAPGDNDPQLYLDLPAPLHVTASWLDFARTALPVMLPVFGALALLLFLFDRTAALRARLAAAGSWLGARPVAAVALGAVLATVVSLHPVIFLGRSLVSPNFGTVLLYDTYPTLPGYKDSAVVDARLSDVGAVMWQHVPFSMMQRRALAAGELPLWNRANAAGVPLLAQGQSMFGDPLHLGVIAADGAAWAWDAKYVVAKALFALGLGLCVLTLLRAGRPETSRAALGAAVLVAVAAPYIGFFHYRINHPAYFSLCYAPWPLYCLLRLAFAASRREIVFAGTGLIAANFALMNSGTVKEAYMLLVSVNFAGAAVIFAAGGTLRQRLGKLIALAWAGLIFVLLTAPIWATFLTTLRQAYTGYNTATAYQIQPTLLLGLFDEIFYRPLLNDDRVFSPSLNFLFLAGFLYLLATLRLQFARAAVAALAAASLVPLALAFGLVPPTWIVTIPFLSNIAHLDNTFSCVLIVLWGVLAGVGFATAAERLGTKEGRADLIIAGLLLGALAFGWIAFRQAAHRPILGPIFTVHQPGQVLAIAPFIWHYLAALLLGCVALALVARRIFIRGALTPSTGLLCAGAVAVLLWRHGVYTDAVGFDHFTLRPPARVDFHARSPAIDFVRAAHAREPGRGYGIQGNFFPGWTGVYNLETVHGPDALVNPWLRELVGVSGVERIWDWRLYSEAAGVAQVRPFFDALNVRFYFDILSKHPALAANLSFVHGSDLDVYESRTVWPRAFFTDRLGAYAKPEELVPLLRGADGKPLAAAQADDPDAAAVLAKLPRDLAGRTAVAATAYRLTPNTTRFKVRATGPGVVVLTEVFWAGDFRAEINGRKAQVLRLNHAFKGVAIEAAGEHDIVFRYVPKNFPRNLALGGLGLALLAGSVFVGLRRPGAAA